MAPKKNTSSAPDPGTIVGFDAKETKILAAAFIASIAPGKVDYDVMARLTGNTASTVKTYFPAIKAKAVEDNEAFAAYVGVAAKTATPKKAAASKKRKEPDAGGDEGDATGEAVAEDGQDKPTAKGKAGRPKKVKTSHVEGGADDDDGKKAKGKGGRGKKAQAAKKAEEATAEDAADGDAVMKDGIDEV